MGCDIHLYVERRDTDGAWAPVEDPFDTRNYRLFAALAGVRNGVGFAGCDLGDPIKPIAEPRGLPEDVSAEVRQDSDSWDIDGHTHSWLTAGELLGHDWDMVVVNRGLTLDTDDAHFKAGGRAKWVVEYFEQWHEWPPNTEVVGGTTSTRYVPIEWRIPLSANLSTDWFAFVLRLGRMAGDDLGSVRIVFWFDN